MTKCGTARDEKMTENIKKQRFSPISVSANEKISPQVAGDLFYSVSFLKTKDFRANGSHAEKSIIPRMYM